MTKKFDIAGMVTERMLEKTRETGQLPWQKPWASIYYQNAVSGHKYRGVNILMLAFFGTDTHYVTMRAVNKLGGKIRKGAKGIPIVFWSPIERTKDGEKEKFLMLRYYTVFALNDVEGITLERKGVKLSVFQPIETAERIARLCGVPIQHGGNKAAYSPVAHVIYMPKPEQFDSTEAYYKTLFHEITHAMSRNVGDKLDTSFGEDAYAREELIAEMGANFLMSFCGIDSEKLADNSAAYLSCWMKRIAEEPKLLVTAAGRAQKRFDEVLRLIGEIADEEESTETAEAVA